jgi:hypothetical protein
MKGEFCRVQSVRYYEMTSRVGRLAHISHQYGHHPERPPSMLPGDETAAFSSALTSRRSETRGLRLRVEFWIS